MNYSYLPAINACLNTICAGFLVMGFVRAKQRDAARHKRMMLTALVTSALFLISYVIYHYAVGSVPYPYQDWTRPVYFTILIPHIILAAVQVPFIVLALWFAFRAQYDRHRRVVAFAWPIWMFVSVSGLVVYLMLYHS